MQKVIEKIKNKIIKNRYYILSFLIPVLITFLTFLYIGIFLEKNILISDLKGQYISFFAHYKQLFIDNNFHFYSFNKGIGGSMFGTIAYYLLSPLNLISLLFSLKALPVIIAILILIKIGFSGLTMYYFLKKKVLANDYNLLMFSIMYSLMGFTVGYIFNVMWLDVIYLLPLMIYGIEKILDGKSPTLYSVVLFLSIISNFYMSYMLMVFSALYVVLKTFMSSKNKQYKIIVLTKYSISTFLTIVSCAIVLVPLILELSLSPKVGTGLFNGQKLFLNLNIFDLFSKLFIGSQSFINILNFKGAYIYSGTICLPLVYFYFVNKKIKTKDKIFSSIILLILIFSFQINYLNYFWHGMVIPQAFDARYSFLFSFYIIYISAQSFIKVNYIEKTHYFIVAAAFSIISLIVLLFNYFYLNYYMIYLTLSMLLLYLFLLYNKNNTNVKDYKLINLLLFLLVLSESLFNIYFSLYNYDFSYSNEYKGYLNKYGQQIENINKNDNSLFYRIGSDKKYSFNDSFLLNYNGMNAFITTISSNQVAFFKKNGYTDSQNGYLYNQSNPIIDSILGVKYIIANNFYSPYYKKLYDFKYSMGEGLFYGMAEKDVNVYENLDALSLGYMISDTPIKDINNKVKESPYYSNQILNSMIGEESKVMSDTNLEKLDINHFKLTVNTVKHMLLFLPTKNTLGSQEIIKIYVNNKLWTVYMSNDSGFIWIENKYKQGDIVDIRIEPSNPNIVLGDLQLYYFNYSELKNKIEILKTNQMTILENKDYYIKGQINVKNDKKILFTSIPYEPGWKAYVDGKETPILKLYGTFNGLKLDEGNHIIEFKYSQPGLKCGSIISIISIIILIIYLKKEKFITKKVANIYFKYEEIILYLIVGILTTLVGLSSYFVFSKILGINYLISSVLSWIISIIFAFFANKIAVFKSAGNIIKEAFEFIKYRLLSLLIDIIMMYIMVSILLIDDFISKIVVQIVIIIINYLFSKIFIFKESNEKK